jgi:hypothetical protein
MIDPQISQITQITMKGRFRFAISTGFNSPQVAAFGYNLAYMDTPGLPRGDSFVERGYKNINETR